MLIALYLEMTWVLCWYEGGGIYPFLDSGYGWMVAKGGYAGVAVGTGVWCSLLEGA
jgi:hypothetical protein